MSWMFTLISRRPTFCSSLSTPLVMLSMSCSRSALMSSMDMVAMTTRIWPKMMSRARSWTFCMDWPSRRSAAFCITPGSVETPTVNVDGVLTRMFCRESALSSLMSMGMGVRSRNAWSWSTGHTKVAPPWMHLDDWAGPLPPILP